MQITMEVAVPVVEYAIRVKNEHGMWSREDINYSAQKWAIERTPQQVLKPLAVEALMNVFANLDLGI